MFNIPLYKQSWKANWVLWLITTLVSCFVLTIIMLIIGGKGMGTIHSSIDKGFVEDELSANFKATSLNYYNVSNDSLEEFDKAFLDIFVEELKTNPAPVEEIYNVTYQGALAVYINSVNHKIKEINEDYTEDTPEYEELNRAALAVLNPNGLFNEMYQEFEPDMQVYDYDILTLVNSLDYEDISQIRLTGEVPEDLYDVVYSKARINYRNSRAMNGSIIILSGIMSSDEAINTILNSLDDSTVDRKIYDDFGFHYNGLKELSSEAIITYQSLYDYKLSLLDPLDSNYTDEKSLLKAELQNSIASSVLSNMPEEMKNLLEDMGSGEMYGDTLDNIYYRIIGMLIAIVYIIMASINLISGQIESGSMAYVLSSGTKRSTITFTQAIFLISSVFFMFLTTTIVSLICYNIATPTASDVKLIHLPLFSLFTFFVAFAFCGINFLTSAVFNRLKLAVGIGGGLSIISIIFTIIGLFSSNMLPSVVRINELNVFNKFSIISLYDGPSIIAGTSAFIWKGAILIALGLIGFIIGSIIFKRKDLPL